MVAALAAAAVFGVAEQAAAQVLPFAVEVRGGYAIPTGDLAEGDGIEDGLGFGANLQLSIMPMIGVYAGWERYSFGVEDLDDASIIDSGFRGGLQFNAPLATFTGVSPFVFGGAIYNSTEMEIGDESAESDSSVGFEVGGGVGIQLAPMFTLTPALRYRTHSSEFEGSDDSVSYLSIDVGLKVGI